jgi:hypothetical protein
MNQTQVQSALKTGLALMDSDDVRIPTSHLDGAGNLRQFLTLVATGRITLTITPEKVPAPAPEPVPDLPAA